MATGIEGKKSTDVNIKLDKPKWLKVDGDEYKVDHVINAYLSGKESALTDLAKTVERQQKEVLAKGMEVVDNYLEMMESDLQVSFKEARLKQVDMFEIDSIIILESEDYFSDKLDEIYDLYFEYEEQLDIDFNIGFKFTFSSEHLSINKLELDGFKYFRQ